MEIPQGRSAGFRLSLATYRRICVGALWSLCGIVVTGAGVRLTGSGLGCSDWPTCENSRLVAPLEFHAMVEFLNRVITGLVSVAVAAAVLGSLVLVERRRDLTRWSLSLVVGVIAQIVIGAFVTLSDLSYSVVAIHFLVSMVLVWAATVLIHLASQPQPALSRRDRAPLPGWARYLSVSAVALLLAGPVITSAGPHAGDPNVKRLPVDLGWAARVHSLTAWFLLAGVLWVGWSARLSTSTLVRRRTQDLLYAVLAQGVIGYLQYFTDVPAGLVATHVAGATLVWVLTIRLVLTSREMPSTQKPRRTPLLSQTKS